MKCASCGHENPEDMQFCLECGARLVNGCPTCGAELLPGAKFCGKCGQRLSADDGQSDGRSGGGRRRRQREPRVFRCGDRQTVRRRADIGTDFEL